MSCNRALNNLYFIIFERTLGYLSNQLVQVKSQCQPDLLRQKICFLHRYFCVTLSAHNLQLELLYHKHVENKAPRSSIVTVGGTSHRFQIFSEAHDHTQSHQSCLYTGIRRPYCVPEWVSQWCSKTSMKHLTSRDIFSLVGLLMAAVCFTDSSQGAQKHSLVIFFYPPLPAASKTAVSIVVTVLSSNNYHWPGKAQNTLQSSFEAG